MYDVCIYMHPVKWNKVQPLSAQCFRARSLKHFFWPVLSKQLSLSDSLRPSSTSAIEDCVVSSSPEIS